MDEAENVNTNEGAAPAVAPEKDTAETKETTSTTESAVADEKKESNEEEDKNGAPPIDDSLEGETETEEEVAPHSQDVATQAAAASATAATGSNAPRPAGILKKPTLAAKKKDATSKISKWTKGPSKMINVNLNNNNKNEETESTSNPTRTLASVPRPSVPAASTATSAQPRSTTTTAAVSRSTTAASNGPSDDSGGKMVLSPGNFRRSYKKQTARKSAHVATSRTVSHLPDSSVGRNTSKRARSPTPSSSNNKKKRSRSKSPTPPTAQAAASSSQNGSVKASSSAKKTAPTKSSAAKKQTPVSKKSTTKTPVKASASKASAKKKKKTPGGKKPGSEPIWEGDPDETITGGWPKGWIKRTFRRQSGASQGATDSYWYSPIENHKLRSMAEVRRYFAALKENGGDEKAAWKRRKG